MQMNAASLVHQKGGGKGGGQSWGSVVKDDLQ